MALRRIGMPGLPFWKEFCAEVFMRFALICERRGAIKPAAVDGKRVSLVAYNPAFRAVEANDAAAAARFMELAGQGFPEEYKMEVDGSATMHALAEKLGRQKLSCSAILKPSRRRSRGLHNCSAAKCWGRCRGRSRRCSRADGKRAGRDKELSAAMMEAKKRIRWSMRGSASGLPMTGKSPENCLSPAFLRFA